MPVPAVPVPLGMVHGRFQPFHVGHLDYLTKAATRCGTLVVGITNPDPTHVRAEEANPARSRDSANPFPYHLRYRMVRGAAVEAGVDPGRLVVVPFPIHEPTLWEHYVPRGAVHFIRVFSDWERQKGERLERAGYRVVVLDAGAAKSVSGTEVRSLLERGGPWRELVPPAVAALLAPAG